MFKSDKSPKLLKGKKSRIYDTKDIKNGIYNINNNSSIEKSHPSLSPKNQKSF